MGVAVALSQFTGISRLAASLLASGAIAAAVLGFAARQTLANFVAGIMIAITQPLRVGDWVFFEDQYGVVEDIRLNYTFMRTLSDQQVVIPNEKLASGILRNDTLGDGARRASTSRSGCRRRPTRAAPSRRSRRRPGRRSPSAEITAEGVRLSVGGEPCAAARPRAARGGAAAALPRRACVRRACCPSRSACTSRGSGARGERKRRPTIDGRPS